MKKVLLLGKSGVGKSSMHSVIFANCPIKDTAKIGYTIGRQQHNFVLMGKLKLNLNDCGGQDEFMEQYFWSQKETVFKNVSLVIYVFDVCEQDKEKLQKTLDYWGRALKCLQKLSPEANVFALIHKIDIIKPSQRAKAFNDKKDLIESVAQKVGGIRVTEYFATTLWDQSLYQAWSKMVQFLIPNREVIEKMLQKFCEASICSEAVLFQKETFLILSHIVHGQQKPKAKDINRCEQVAILIKELKLTANKMNAGIKTIEVRTDNFSGLIQEFTPTQYILVVNNQQISDYQSVKLKEQNLRIIPVNAKILGRQFQKQKQATFKLQ